MKVVHVESGQHCFWCPGCEMVHGITIEGKNPWGWDKNLEAPTYTPSILVTWEGAIEGNPAKKRCHSYITKGKFLFLNDCTHKLAGETVPMVEFHW